jgi:hypothetical protein
MNNLEQLLSEWRNTMLAAPDLERELLNELEDHLREHTRQLVRSGMTETEAFQVAAAQLGTPGSLSSEFQKLKQPTWLPVKLVIGVGLAAALALTLLLPPRVLAKGWGSGFLLAGHVLTISIGYTATFLLGALGICFVGQRCVLDFSPLRLRSLRRVTFILSSIAAGLAGLGLILGMLWTREEWGRYWAWDSKEIGGLCVVVWLICFVSLHKLRRLTAHRLLLMSIGGNIVVSLAWFGANLINSGTPGNWRFLLAAVLFHLAILLVGLAPAGWLHVRKAAG